MQSLPHMPFAPIPAPMQAATVMRPPALPRTFMPQQSFSPQMDPLAQLQQQAHQPQVVAPGLIDDERNSAELLKSGLSPYNGGIRNAAHREWVRAIANKVLSLDEQRLVVAILNTMQVAKQVPGGMPTVEAITWDKVQFVGAEAVVLHAALRSGGATAEQLEVSPILALYEWFFTLDDYLGSVWTQGNRCIQHLLAVQRASTQAGVSGMKTNDIAVDSRGFLMPQMMRDDDLKQLAQQIPPPDFCLWEFRDNLHDSDRRFVQTAMGAAPGGQGLDRLTGLGGALASTMRDTTFVEDAKVYHDSMEPLDKNKFLPGITPQANVSMLFPKTPYQRSLDEAVELSFEQTNTCRALQQGLFRIHFLQARKLSAILDQGTVGTDARPPLAGLLLRLCADALDYAPDAPPLHLPRPEGKHPLTLPAPAGGGGGGGGAAGPFHGQAVATAAIARPVQPVQVSDQPLELHDWVNAMAHKGNVPAVDLTGVGLLQAKPYNWLDWGDNYIKKLWQLWKLSRNPDWVRRPGARPVLPRQGGAIGRIISSVIGPVVWGDAHKTYAWKDGGVVVTPASRSWWWLGLWKTQQQVDPSQQEDNESALAMFPFPHTVRAEKAALVAGGGVATAATIAIDGVHDALNDVLAKAIATPNGLVVAGCDEKVQKKDVGAPPKAFNEGGRFARVKAVDVSQDIIWTRMESMLKNPPEQRHPIMHCARIGRALEDLRAHQWIQETMLNALVRVFAETRTARPRTSALSCLPGTHPYPVTQDPTTGRLTALSMKDAMVVDPIKGQFSWSPAVDFTRSSCVIPGSTAPPQPVPGVQNMVPQHMP
jgi:hypothetical protein